MEALLLSALRVALTLGFGAAGLRWALQRAERERLRRACVESIAQLRPARFAAARGRAVPVGEPLVSPFSGRPCVAFRVVRWRQERKGGFGPNNLGDGRAGDRTSPQPIELRSDDDPLYIGDGRRANA